MYRSFDPIGVQTGHTQISDDFSLIYDTKIDSMSEKYPFNLVCHKESLDEGTFIGLSVEEARGLMFALIKHFPLDAMTAPDE